MQNFILVVGIVGSVASIISLIIPRDGLRGKLLHAAYVFLISVVAAIAVFQERQLAATRSIALDASELVERRQMDFTDEGYIQAALAFLEKHKEEFPDAYARAKLMCENFKCFDPGADGYDLISASSQLDGLLTGISALSN